MKGFGFLYSIFASVVWGLIYTIDQKILTKISPIALIFIDALIVVIVTFPFLFFDHLALKDLFSFTKYNFILIFISVLLTILANFLILSGIKILGASTASIFEIAYPFFVVIFSYWFFKASLNWTFFIGAILIFLGSFVIIRFG